MRLTVDEMALVAQGGVPKGWILHDQELVDSSYGKGSQWDVVLGEYQAPQDYGFGPDPKTWRFTYWFHEVVGLTDMDDDGFYYGVEVEGHAVTRIVYKEVKRDENGNQLGWT